MSERRLALAVAGVSIAAAVRLYFSRRGRPSGKPPSPRTLNNGTTLALGTPSDFLELAALDRAVWATYPNGENIPDGEHTWGLWCRTALTVIARSADGQCIGGAVAFPTLGENAPLSLHKLFVAASERGSGVGTAVLDLVCAELDRTHSACFLTVNPANERAVACYTKLGFGVAAGAKEFVKGYYRESEDRFVLTRYV